MNSDAINNLMDAKKVCDSILALPMNDLPAPADNLRMTVAFGLVSKSINAALEDCTKGQSSQGAILDRQLMEEIAMLFSGNQGCNFDKTGNHSLLLLIKESVQDIMKRGMSDD